MTERDAVKMIKKILGENEVESVLQRLDRLTLDEAIPPPPRPSKLSAVSFRI